MSYGRVVGVFGASCTVKPDGTRGSRIFFSYNDGMHTECINFFWVIDVEERVLGIASRAQGSQLIALVEGGVNVYNVSIFAQMNMSRCRPVFEYRYSGLFGAIWMSMPNTSDVYVGCCGKHVPDKRRVVRLEWRDTVEMCKDLYDTKGTALTSELACRDTISRRGATYFPFCGGSRGVVDVARTWQGSSHQTFTQQAFGHVKHPSVLPQLRVAHQVEADPFGTRGLGMENTGIGFLASLPDPDETNEDGDGISGLLMDF